MDMDSILDPTYRSGDDQGMVFQMEIIIIQNLDKPQILAQIADPDNLADRAPESMDKVTDRIFRRITDHRQLMVQITDRIFRQITARFPKIPDKNRDRIFRRITVNG